MAASVLEHGSSKIYEHEAAALNVVSCGVFSPEASAILILGETDGLARAAALYFSELGYTIFVLSTSGSEPSSSTLPGKAPTVSALLYAWHKRKERSHRASWGMIAPIALDMHSETQRTHASETVHAYCLNHALHLVALIVLPNPSPAHRSHKMCRRHMPQPAKSSSRGESLAFPVWDKELESSALEPLEVIRDYSDLLMEAYGRVVVMSTCLPNDRQGSESLLDGIRECLVTNMGRALKSSGVRFCSLATGAPEDFSTPCMGAHAAGEALSFPHNPVGSVGEDCMLSGHPDMDSTTSAIASETTSNRYNDAVCRTLNGIITSKYPKYFYAVGFRPWLHWLWTVMPDVLKLLLSL